MSKWKRFNQADIRLIQTYVDTIDKDIQIRKGTTFCVDTYDEIVWLGNKRLDRITKQLMEHWSAEMPIKINWVVLSILHEIGHIMTMTDELEEERTLLDNTYSLFYQMGIDTDKEYFDKYFDIPAERAATLWAIDYYCRNQKQCDDLAKSLKVSFY